MKAGIKTSELWVSLLGVIGGGLMSAFPSSPISQVIGGILAAICGGSYTLGRSWSKGKIGASQSHARTIAEAMLKKSSSG